MDTCMQREDLMAHRQLKTVEKYDPRINEWTSVADMNEVRVGMRLAVVNDRLYAVGGRGGADQETVEVFDPEANQWGNHSNMNEKRFEPGVGVIRTR
ncbi:kelch repeat protein [Cooperia oncophora]